MHMVYFYCSLKYCYYNWLGMGSLVFPSKSLVFCEQKCEIAYGKERITPVALYKMAHGRSFVLSNMSALLTIGLL